jgi:serine/threonine-protein kinase
MMPAVIEEPPAVKRVIAGRYELLELAGRGGMADVWRSRVVGDVGFSRPVAIKQMHRALAEQPLYVKMFLEEARVGSTLDSPNVAKAHDFVEDAGDYFMVLEWIEGVDLGTWIRAHMERGTPPNWELVTAIGVGMMRGLAAAHERIDQDGNPAPIVHRDVSPHNVLLTTRGMVKVIDFGLALASDRLEGTTDPGVVKGKMSYLAPETVAGVRPTAASDIFAAGSVLWESLVGRKLFDGSTDYDTYVRVRDCTVQPLRPLRPDVPSQVSAIIARALSPKPKDRFPSASDMGRALGVTLKKVQQRRDLHAVLGRSVSDARITMGLGTRTGDPSTTTPIVDMLSSPLTPPPGILFPLKPDEHETRSLRHWIPFLGKRRT